jgi:hypothetical protein
VSKYCLYQAFAGGTPIYGYGVFGEAGREDGHTYVKFIAIPLGDHILIKRIPR